MTLLIKNGLLIDGTGSEPRRIDVFVSGDKISALGNFNGKEADVVIDAQGMLVTPGCIDAHSEVDHRLEFLRGHYEGQLREGITTAIGGHEGVSLAPLLYGDLSLFEWWTHIRHANVSWQTMKEFAHVMGKRKPAYNFASFAGYETVAQAITGGSVRDFQKGESRITRTIIDKSIHEGALGVSFGSASRTMRFGKGIAEVPADGESGAPWLAQEAFRHAKEGNGKAVISGVLSRMEHEDVDKLLTSIETNRSHSDVRISCSPSARVRIPLFSYLAEEMLEGGRFAVLARLKDDAFRAKLEKSLPTIDPKTAQIDHDALHTPLHERTLKEFMAWHGIKQVAKGIVRLMEASELHAGITIPQDETVMDRAIASKKSLIGSYGSRTAFSEYLSRIIKDSSSTSRGIKKVTSDVAEFFGLEGRGVLKEQYHADIIGIKDGAVQFTIVNGEVAMNDGKHQGVHAGKFLITNH